MLNIQYLCGLMLCAVAIILIFTDITLSMHQIGISVIFTQGLAFMINGRMNANDNH